LKILLVGEESAGLQALKAIARTENDIVAVMTSSDSSSTNASVSLAAFAEDLGCAVSPPQIVKDPDFAHEVRAAGTDLILNVHSLYIIHEEVLRAPRIGAFNVHPGPLPYYAGLNTVSWAIYRGEVTHGVTVHWMVPKIDAGDIAYQSMFPLEENDSALSLTHKCVRAAIPLVSKLLEAASLNPAGIPKVRQNFSARQYFDRQIPEGGCLSWARPAREIVNFVRACDYCPYPSPWGHPKVFWRNRGIAIIRAVRTHLLCQSPPGTVGQCEDTGVLVATADEWALVQQLEIDGGYVKPQSILRSGDRLHDGR
jgi:UDP-4-amino-4-deoxy-L-arabinose formyltransferase/UDP-glucuronic acid dehydrogenase (UDP-4-keto-hexauronic acid decarboxylating)